MQLEIIRKRSKESVPLSFSEILNMSVPVVLEIDKPLERMSDFEKRRRERGKAVREKLLYTNAKSGKTYCGGTFLNNYTNNTHWDLYGETKIFLPRRGLFYIRHSDKLLGTADYYLVRDLKTEEFISCVEDEGFQFMGV